MNKHVNFSCPQVDDEPPKCDNDTTTILDSTDYCGYIEDTNGPFRQCISSATDGLVEMYMKNCVYDVCAVYDEGEEARKEAACSSLAAFAEVCKSEATPPNQDWRDTAGCGKLSP